MASVNSAASRTGGIDRQQPNAVRHTAGSRTECQDRAKDRSDARRPSKREGQAQDVGSERATPRNVECEAGVTRERFQTEGTQHDQSEQDDDRPAQIVEFSAPGQKQRPERAGPGTQRDKDRGKSQNEAGAQPKCPGARPQTDRPCRAQIRLACDVGNIARNQWQDAG